MIGLNQALLAFSKLYRQRFASALGRSRASEEFAQFEKSRLTINEIGQGVRTNLERLQGERENLKRQVTDIEAARSAAQEGLQELGGTYAAETVSPVDLNDSEGTRRSAESLAGEARSCHSSLERLGPASGDVDLAALRDGLDGLQRFQFIDQRPGRSCDAFQACPERLGVAVPKGDVPGRPDFHVQAGVRTDDVGHGLGFQFGDAASQTVGTIRLV